MGDIRIINKVEALGLGNYKTWAPLLSCYWLAAWDPSLLHPPLARHLACSGYTEIPLKSRERLGRVFCPVLRHLLKQ